MAFDKAVDSAALDAGLTSVANAIRAKGGETTAKMDFPSGFVSAVNAIVKGVDVKTATGSGTTDINGLASFTCGFKPDLVYLNGAYTFEEAEEYFLCYPFAGSVMESSGYQLYGVAFSDTFEFGIFARFERSNTGFTVTMTMKVDENENYQNLSNYPVSYTAVKYTA